MELRHLRYFVAIGEEEHYGRAALRLRVAQPALSRQIQDLEEEVGFKLFDRLRRGVKISSAGKLVRSGPEDAAPIGSCLEERQWFPAARKIRRQRAALTGGASIGKTLKVTFS